VNLPSSSLKHAVKGELQKMPELSIVARIKVKNDSAVLVKKELIQLVAPTRKEKGCIHYNLHQDNDCPDTFVFYENWESEAHLEEHQKSDHFTSCFSKIDDMIEEIRVNRLTWLA
jgi:quinol monooxygenase YgiN